MLPTPELFPISIDFDAPKIISKESSTQEQEPPIVKADKKQLKKAKKARQAAARAVANSAKTTGAEKLNEAAKMPGASTTERDISTPLISPPFAQNASSAPLVGPSTPPTPRLTAAEKGKGKANPLSSALRSNRTPSHTSKDPHLNENPNKRKASESPAEPKVLKKNTAMANSPLHTPIRLSDMREQAPGTYHRSLALSSSPQISPLHLLIDNVHITPHQTTNLAQDITPPKTKNTTSYPLPFPDGYDIFTRLPSADDIEKAIKAHIRLKPAFCGTETEFNKRTMRLQELLTSVLATNQPEPGTALKGHSGPYRSPPPPSEHHFSKTNRGRANSPQTPTPYTRYNPTLNRPGPPQTQPNANLPPRHNQQRQNNIREPTQSNNPHHLPSVSPMSESDDGISMIDSEGWLERNTSMPPSDVWADEHGPPIHPQP
ncbi:hypothetical protein H0H93_008584 [Arthromyces matolae]|nr:hypothetical protein H0H93_008584 [Arthromyces matolae]